MAWIRACGGGSPAIPDGKTVTPINDVTIWQQCAGIANPTYTTLADVLADIGILQTLMASDNAVDYLVRCIGGGWVTTITANQNAMYYIGQNNYCANTLLATPAWRDYVCTSTYFESVLNVKVPVMTSNTTPSGVASATSASASEPAWKAFDNDTSTRWGAADNQITNQRLQYKFTTAVKIYKIVEKYNTTQPQAHPKNIKYQCSNDGSNWTDKASEVWALPTASGSHNTVITNTESAQYWALFVQNNNGSSYFIYVNELQFYGREDV